MRNIQREQYLAETAQNYLLVRAYIGKRGLSGELVTSHASKSLAVRYRCLNHNPDGFAAQPCSFKQVLERWGNRAHEGHDFWMKSEQILFWAESMNPHAPQATLSLLSNHHPEFLGFLNQTLMWINVTEQSAHNSRKFNSTEDQALLRLLRSRLQALILDFHEAICQENGFPLTQDIELSWQP